MPAPSTLRSLLAFYLGHLPLEDDWDGWNENAHHYQLKTVQWLEWECPQSHRFEHGVSSWRIIQKGVGVGLAGEAWNQGGPAVSKAHPAALVLCLLPVDVGLSYFTTTRPSVLLPCSPP